MPTYEYECLKCGFKFESFHNINSTPIKKCPKCNSQLRRLIGGGCGLIFKGSGFYITDYKRKQKYTDTKSDQSKSEDKSKEEKK